MLGAGDTRQLANEDFPIFSSSSILLQSGLQASPVPLVARVIYLRIHSAGISTLENRFAKKKGKSEDCLSKPFLALSHHQKTRDVQLDSISWYKATQERTSTTERTKGKSNSNSRSLGRVRGRLGRVRSAGRLSRRNPRSSGRFLGRVRDDGVRRGDGRLLRRSRDGVRRDDGRLVRRLRDGVSRFDGGVRCGRFLRRVRSGVSWLGGSVRSRDRSGVRFLGLVVVCARPQGQHDEIETKVKAERTRTNPCHPRRIPSESCLWYPASQSSRTGGRERGNEQVLPPKYRQTASLTMRSPSFSCWSNPMMVAEMCRRVLGS